MNPLTEKELQIELPDGAYGRKFDDHDTHRLSHCMKAVDFIVELEDRILFIECKDPDNPKASEKDRQAFLDKLMSSKLDADLKTKYRDSFLYEWGCGRVTKPIYYLVLIAASVLTDEHLLLRTEALQRQIPVMGPGDKPWKKPFVAGCAVMNLETWNKKLRQFPITRIGGTLS